MIGLLLAINWLSLKRDRLALGLSFGLPLLFFSTFALIFGQWGADPTGFNPVEVIIVDQDHTDISRWFVMALSEQPELRVVSGHPSGTEQGAAPPGPRDAAIEQVRSGAAAAAIIIPPGFGASFAAFSQDISIEVVYNAANPVARFLVSGLLQSAALVAAPVLLWQQSIAFLEQFAQSLSPEQRQIIDTLLIYLRRARPWETPQPALAEPRAGPDPGTAVPLSWFDTARHYAELARVPVQTTDVRGDNGDLVTYYAAGIGVMFLLFSMAGASGAFLEEKEAGTLERVLNTNLGIGTLLVGKWLFFTMLAVAQLVLMFVWGALVFGLDLWTVNHLIGFLVMACATATAAAAFGLVLAPLCTSRAQLSGIATIVILLMSVLSGSMVPRFVLPAFMHDIAKFTFNGWALEGFLKVFWYDDPQASLGQSLLSLWPEVAVLAAITLVCLASAGVLARRWETV
jgi:ABC-2 type transport system permease protein